MQTTADARSDLRRALTELAGNLWFSWNPAARALFARLDPEAWERTGHNPRALLAQLPDELLEQAAEDGDVVGDVEALRAAFEAELREASWWARAPVDDQEVRIAYFCAEFGVDESLPVYSGGLGVLAGDHLKAASELGVPLIGIGLFYQRMLSRAPQ